MVTATASSPPLSASPSIALVTQPNPQSVCSASQFCRGREPGASGSGGTRPTLSASAAAAAASTSRRAGAALAATLPAGSANVHHLPRRSLSSCTQAAPRKTSVAAA
ncbi:hypothetical protein BHE74_00005761 [Ensete ventricosum]|uniref:Uncharacterized protein n=1 Tax=Ensete ventricosum TaxID=4639 RepID=A0A427BC50_ENSVE|nr:hypothetical protein B296_00002027 [Ensete ventricosum]RWW85543.1 hypothetical protein BHE74_00005761 [Ensete ventricosum]RZR77384.1 hypothetical protein BHM03_00002427 [Ensete ventricosum]